MKKRDKFWLNKILWNATVFFIFILVSLYNIIQFNNSYIQEEKSEIYVYRTQVEWAVTPILKEKNIPLLQKYCNEFKDSKDFAVRIFDNRHNIIAGTNMDTTSELAKNDSRLIRSKYNLWELYKRSFKDKKLEHVSEIIVNNSKYYIEISISAEEVIDSIIKAQKNIIILCSICIILLILNIIYNLSLIRKAFNTLEDSTIKIAKGDLNTKITIPRNGLLEELAISVTKMTQRLKMQIDRLSKLEQYKTEFLQNITHEIKTPITAINSAIELCETENTTDAVKKECFEIIKFQTNAITKLVRNILTLSETDLKKTDAVKDFTNINLSEAINEAISNQGIISTKINLNINENISTVKANKELFITAISNLLGNALKYSGSEIIDINIYPENRSVIIEIKDYGKGISAEHLPYVFDRFYRVDKSRSRQNGGTGLGLSIVKNIIELHNWKIQAKSIPNNYTIFKITI